MNDLDVLQNSFLFGNDQFLDFLYHNQSVAAEVWKALSSGAVQGRALRHPFAPSTAVSFGISLTRVEHKGDCGRANN